MGRKIKVRDCNWKIGLMQGPQSLNWLAED